MAIQHIVGKDFKMGKIGLRILDLIKQKGMTQKEFSIKTGIPQSTISDWRGKDLNPNVDKIMIICEVLGISSQDLLSAGTVTEPSSIDYIYIDKNSREFNIITDYRNLTPDDRLRLEGYLTALSQKKCPYIFFSDLDDTLLTTKKEVSPKTYEALKAFTDKGNIFVICTGRGLDSALKVQKKYGLTFPHSFIAAYNGCQIYDCDAEKTIFKVGIPLPVVKDIFNTAEEYGVYVHTYSDEYILTSKNDEEIQDYRSKVSTPVHFCPDPAGYLDAPPCKVICIELHDHAKQERFRKAVNEKYGDVLDTMYSSPYYLELIPKGYGKGTAVKELAKHLNIPIEHTIAAGDAENDNSMLIAAGLGIAMKNAAEGTKKAADVITDTDCDNDGLVPFLV